MFSSSIAGRLPLFGRRETVQRSATIFSRLFSQACFSRVMLCPPQAEGGGQPHAQRPQRSTSRQQLRHSKNWTLSVLGLCCEVLTGAERLALNQSEAPLVPPDRLEIFSKVIKC